MDLDGFDPVSLSLYFNRNVFQKCLDRYPMSMSFGGSKVLNEF